MSTEKFSVWVYWTVFCCFGKSSHAIYLMWCWSLLFFQEFTSIIPFMVWFQDSSQIEGRGYILMSSNVCYCLPKVLFFNWKLNIPSFIFLIWQQQFWIWFSLKFKKKHQFFFVFQSFSYFTPYMIFEPWFRSINW